MGHLLKLNAEIREDSGPQLGRLNALNHRSFIAQIRGTILLESINGRKMSPSIPYDDQIDNL